MGDQGMRGLNSKQLIQLHELKKACQNAAGKSENGKYLPLWMHMTDTAGAVDYLMNQRLTKSQLRILEEGMDEKQKTKLWPAVRVLGFLHDLGKMASVFQVMIQRTIPVSYSFPLPMETSVVASSNDIRNHATLGMIIALKEGFPEGYAAIIGAHHGRFQADVRPEKLIKELSNIVNYPFVYGNSTGVPLYQTAWQDIVKAVLVFNGFEDLTELPSFSLPAQMILSGLLIAADWIASNQSYFPLIEVSDSGCVNDYPNRWEAAFEKVDFSKPWHSEKGSMSLQEFEQAFHFTPTAMQKKVLDVMSGTDDPGILIVEAPMGNGKTEAALAAAEIMAARSGSGGVYFGQPTQATANGLFTRFASWSADHSSNERHSIRLAHGMANLNQDYADLPMSTAHVDDDDPDSTGSLFIQDWMQNPKTGLLSDFVIGTVDQGLMAALNHRHVMLRHLGLTSKVVILDEVHAYDAYMGVFFNGLLRWLGYYRVPVILLSATLPAYKKNEMLNAYMSGVQRLNSEDAEVKLDRTYTYPLITWSDGFQVNETGVDQPTTEVSVNMIAQPVQSKEQELNKIEEILDLKLADGGCAGVILNTVSKAQQVSEYLKNRFPEKRILTFHSRYTAGDRAKIEKSVLNAVGKYSDSKDRNNLIVVGTQVLEQSLDIDFDCMITELAPIDLLLQRAGRLHRHKRPQRPENLRTPELYIITSDEQIIAAHPGVYDPYYLTRSLRSLHTPVRLPCEIPVLVSSVYDETGESSSFDESLRKAKEQRVKTLQDRAEVGQLKAIRFGRRAMKSINAIGKLNMVTDEETAIHSVRDIDPSLSVLLLKRIGNGMFESADQADRIYNSHKKLTVSEIRKLLESRINLPMPNENRRKQIENELIIAAENEFSLWQAQPLLKNILFMILDDKNDVVCGSQAFHYSHEFGLQIK